MTMQSAAQAIMWAFFFVMVQCLIFGLIVNVESLEQMRDSRAVEQLIRRH